MFLERNRRNVGIPGVQEQLPGECSWKGIGGMSVCLGLFESSSERFIAIYDISERPNARFIAICAMFVSSSGRFIAKYEFLNAPMHDLSLYALCL